MPPKELRVSGPDDAAPSADSTLPKPPSSSKPSSAKVLLPPISNESSTAASAATKPSSKPNTPRTPSRTGTSFLKRRKTGVIQQIKTFSLEVALDGFQPASVMCTYAVDAPHTLSWDVDIRDAVTDDDDDGDGIALPKGSCTLYLYPRVTTALEPRGVLPEAAGERALRMMLVSIATKTDAFEVPDPVGAYAIHALVVCNTEESLAVSTDMYRLRPQWLTQVHAPSGPFSGESALHICCVNKREALLIELVQLAVAQLHPAQVEVLLRSQTEGVFFEGAPMRYFGSTTLAYACSFDMREAVIALLATGIVELNQRADGCRLSGFLPLHAVVASSQEGMLDFVTTQLPREWRADVDQVTKVGRLESALDLASLSPLQLAAVLGDRALVRHILKKQCEVMWVWGPVTQFALDLKGIDSSGRGGGGEPCLPTHAPLSILTQRYPLNRHPPRCRHYGAHRAHRSQATHLRGGPSG